MVNFNAKKVLFGLSLAAMASGASAATWSNVTNKYLKEPSFTPGWCGALTAIGDGVGEVYDGPFEIYQVINDAPAGEYTLTATAFLRFGNNDYDKTNAEAANHNAYLYLGTAKEAIKHLFLGGALETAPNSMAEASAMFEGDTYLNTVKFTHNGGDLRFGLYEEDYRQDMWCCFDNFKLVGPNGEIVIENGDFSKGLNAVTDKKDGEYGVYGSWDVLDNGNKFKIPDFNKGGGMFRKTNATVPNIGQRIELPAGTYRFGLQSFYRHGNGNQSGWYTGVKGSWSRTEGESAYDLHINGKEDETKRPFLYVTTDEYKPLSAEDGEFILQDGGMYKSTRIKCIFDETLDYYPDNEPKTETVEEGQHGWCDSGYECEAAEVMVKNPNLYRNYVEFELSAPAKVWVGFMKESNEGNQWWHPFRDFTLETLTDGAGINGITTDAVEATVEYYNLQGIRVAEPTNGIYIVRKGNKAEKVVF